MIEFETQIMQVIQRTHDVKSFRFALKQEISFKPGQFFFVTIKIGDEEKTKHFSFSNSPTETGYVEFTKRITGSPFSQALNNIRAGDWARLRMPYGSFTFEGEYKEIALLSAGIGITPLRSICKFIADKKLPTNEILLYGKNEQKDIIFKDDFDNISRLNKNIRIVYTLTSPYTDKESWDGERGYIDTEMIKEEVKDYKDRIFYICGPPKMVEGLVEVLKTNLAIAEEKIKIENFIGY